MQVDLAFSSGKLETPLKHLASWQLSQPLLWLSSPALELMMVPPHAAGHHRRRASRDCPGGPFGRSGFPRNEQ